MDCQAFLAKVEGRRRDGHRLVMINATAVKATPEGAGDGCELLWTFERQGQLEHLRERVADGEEVPSVSGLYPFAWLYENEVRELFGVNVTGLNVDLKGQLYRTAVKVPLSLKAIRARVAARAAAAPAKGKKS
jgi:ech hydrogenase subunit D